MTLTMDELVMELMKITPEELTIAKRNGTSVIFFSNIAQRIMRNTPEPVNREQRVYEAGSEQLIRKAEIVRAPTPTRVAEEDMRAPTTSNTVRGKDSARVRTDL